MSSGLVTFLELCKPSCASGQRACEERNKQKHLKHDIHWRQGIIALDVGTSYVAVGAPGAAGAHQHSRRSGGVQRRPPSPCGSLCRYKDTMYSDITERHQVCTTTEPWCAHQAFDLKQRQRRVSVSLSQSLK